MNLEIVALVAAALTLLGSMWVVLASASLVARGPLPGSVLTIML